MVFSILIRMSSRFVQVLAVIVVVCVVVITADVVWRSRYVVRGANITDLWTKRYCYPDSCAHIGVPAPRSTGFEDLIPLRRSSPSPLDSLISRARTRFGSTNAHAGLTGSVKR